LLELEVPAILPVGQNLPLVLIEEGPYKASFVRVHELEVPHVGVRCEGVFIHWETIKSLEHLISQALLTHSFQVFRTHILGIGTGEPGE
jgi:hypothetical protein